MYSPKNPLNTVVVALPPLSDVICNWVTNER